MSDELIQFLCDRLNEDEAAALPWPEDQRNWEVRGARYVTYAASPAQEQVTAINVGGDGALGWERISVKRDSEQKLGEHIARHDPARVLHEIDAKRQLVKLHGRATLRAGGGAQHYATATVCRSCEPDLQFPELSWPCATLRLLALPYADRPGYHEEWRP